MNSTPFNSICILGTNLCTLAFFNSNKEFIDGFYITGLNEGICDIPSGSIYCCGQWLITNTTDEPFLYGINDNSINKRLKYLEITKEPLIIDDSITEIVNAKMKDRKSVV